ncbi:universal stress protein [Sphingomonas sp. KC8]|uniref:universal stress protein n=1 Tax=Sphingomonas sp. KC8 TaxID=1030157 RepID=UPI00031EB451|nr:universal stress protein [Sphingomonas sp. KC8]ARS28904.1 hypothetical protein KC8_16675 [Sphingomonas sp. KC8]
MLKDILAVVEGGDQCLPAIDTAIALARRHDAHLGVTVLTEQAILITAYDPIGYAWPAPERDTEHEQQLAAIRDRVTQMGIAADVRGFCDDPTLLPGLVNVEGRYADLVLFGPSSCWVDTRLRRHAIEATVIGAGAHTLLSPDDWQPGPVTHAVLGWNASAEAARAARALIAFADPGARIDVVTIDAVPSPDGHGPAPGSDIARHLARHGFQVDVHREASAGQPIAQVLQSFTRDRGADLLAIGAFAHSRFREILLGGVTRDLIAGTQLPILMVH